MLRCRTCGTTRYEVIDRYGDIATRRYRYADGYQLDLTDVRLDDSVGGGMPKAHFRVEWMARAGR